MVSGIKVPGSGEPVKALSESIIFVSDLDNFDWVLSAAFNYYVSRFSIILCLTINRRSSSLALPAVGKAITDVDHVPSSSLLSERVFEFVLTLTSEISFILIFYFPENYY